MKGDTNIELGLEMRDGSLRKVRGYIRGEHTFTAGSMVPLQQSSRAVNLTHGIVVKDRRSPSRAGFKADWADIKKFDGLPVTPPEQLDPDLARILNQQ